MNKEQASSGGAAAAAKPIPPLWTLDYTLVCLDNFLIFISFHMLASTIPLYVKDLGGSDVMVGLVAVIYTVTALSMRPFAGRWLDNHGRKGIWLAGTAAFLLAVLGYNLAATIPLLLALRIFHGGSWGIVTTSAATSVTDLIPPSRRGEGMGFFGVGSNLGMAVGPIAGLYIIANTGFQAMFLLAAGISLLALILITRIRLPAIQGMKDIKRQGMWEPTAFKPALIFFFATFAMGGILTFIALYGAENGIANPGIFFTTYAITLIITRPISGKIYDRKGERVILIVGFLLYASGMVLLSLNASAFSFVYSAVVSGIGYGSILPVMQALSVKYCAPNRRGAAQATYQSSFDLGIGVGSLFLGWVSQTIGYHGMYLVSAGMVFTGLILYLAIGVKSSGCNQ